MKNKIYMDFDGVLADFNKGYKDFFGRDAKKDDSFTVKQFCYTKPHFYRDLPINPKGLELFYKLKDKYEIIFLTTPMEGMIFCKIDKLTWVKENLGDYTVYFSDNKSEYVEDEESVLIDDMDYNLIPWSEAGGTAIKFPQSDEKILNTIENIFNPEKEVKKVRSALKNIDVNLRPTEKQKISGIYKKGSIIFKDIPIKIENPKGSIRWGFGEDGKKWVQKMKAHYGYIEKTEGNDYDPIDVFIGPKLGASRAFIVNQGKNGMFDEHKIILGCEDTEEAARLYLSNYKKNWNGLMSIKQTNTKKLREWLKDGNKTEPF
jgi:5'(3')-deoxyribonucleotidase